jgi:hypothetical protein
MRLINKYLLVGGLIVILLVVAFVGIFMWKGSAGKSAYTAVFLKTGDLYFGKLVRFPSYGLQRPYFLQIDKNNPQGAPSLQSFKNVLWGPEDFININRDEVVWTSRIRSDSNLAKVLDNNPDLLGSAPAAQNNQTSSTQSGAPRQ